MPIRQKKSNISESILKMKVMLLGTLSLVLLTLAVNILAFKGVLIIFFCSVFFSFAFHVFS